jgi:hypothetical protein
MHILSVGKKEGIGCYDCYNLAEIVIETKDCSIYFCKDCLDKLEELIKEWRR